MNSVKDFMKMQEITSAKITQQITELQTYCAEYEDIGTFVYYMTLPMIYPNIKNTQESKISSALHTLVWQISNVSFNSFHCSWIEEILSFIGNYFLDDSYFKVERSKPYGMWVGSYGDDDSYTQDPMVLVEAAKDNAHFMKIFDSELFDDLLFEYMATSGEVEKRMKPRRSY